ncbi:MAG: hypothetical protein COB36_10085 [Alphaproteobacteria bacterium]|nr:MAG: hypothetical protein COB36_10085 [Alphaproteobacteria bacterium]
MHNLKKHRFLISDFRMAKLKAGALCGLLCLLLVFAQYTSLNHNHDGDLQAQTDCEICLKIGSLDDLATSGNANLSVIVRAHFVASDSQSQPFFATPVQKARAPPSHA